jgi:hypothetical protein
MTARPDVHSDRFDDDRPERRPMASSPCWNDLHDTARTFLHVDFTVPGLGPVVRGWWDIADALHVSVRVAQRMAARGELIVARERTTGGGRGRVWCSVGEAVTVARLRAGLPAADLDRIGNADRAALDRAVERVMAKKRDEGEQPPAATDGETAGRCDPEKGGTE